MSRLPKVKVSLVRRPAPPRVKPSARTRRSRNRRRLQWTLALIVLALGTLAAVTSWWPFDSHPRIIEHYPHPTFWQFLLADRITLGVVRVAILAMAAYIATSIPALISVGRWLRVFGTQGFAADTAEEAKEVIKDLEVTDEESEAVIEQLTAKLEQRTKELDEATRTLEEVREVIRQHLASEPPPEQPPLSL